MSKVEVGKEEMKNIKNTSMRLGIRINYVFFPLDLVELIDILTKSGYVPMAPPPPPTMPRVGVRLSITGPIARKGEVIIDINDDRGVLGTRAPSPKLAIDAFDEVCQLIKTHLKVDLDEMALFYELTGNMEIETDKNPVERIGEAIKRSKVIEAFGQILGRDISLFSLRLSPAKQIPNQAEWFDITIEPDLIKTSIYNVQVVYRSRKKPEVQKFAEEFPLKISKIIETIEAA